MNLESSHAAARVHVPAGSCCRQVAGDVLWLLLQAAPELRLTVQRHLYDALQRLDAALLNECSSFTAEGYSKVRRTPMRAAAATVLRAPASITY